MKLCIVNENFKTETVDGLQVPIEVPWLSEEGSRYI